MDARQRSWPYLLWAFALLLLTPAGGHLGKNAFGPLEPQLLTALAIGPAGFGLLLASVTSPSIIFPSVAGLLYDRFSGASMLIGAVVAVFLGQVLLIVSFETHKFRLALFGAVVFGAGSGSMVSLQHAVMAVVVSEKHLGMGMGIAVGATNVLRLISNLVLPPLAVRFGILGPLIVVLLMCAVSLLAGVLWVLQDSTREHEGDQSPRSDDINERPLLMQRQVSWVPTGRSCEVWALWVLHTCLMACSVGFSNIAPAYLVQRGGVGVTDIAANQLVARSMRPGSLVGALCGGLVADHTGRGQAATVAAVALVGAFALLSLPASWQFVPPFAPMLVLGLAQGSLATMILAWLPQIIAKDKTAGAGLGYGVMESLAALGESAGNLAVGAATFRWGLIRGGMPVLLSMASCCLCLILVLSRRTCKTQVATAPVQQPTAQPLLGST